MRTQEVWPNAANSPRNWRLGHSRLWKTTNFTPPRRGESEVSVFSIAELNQRLTCNVDDPEGLVVTPSWTNRTLWTPIPSTYDPERISCCHDHYRNRTSRPTGGQPLPPHASSRTVGRHLVVPAHQTVLGATLEFIKLPCDASARFLPSPPWLAHSSWSRQRRGFTRSTEAA